MSTVKFKDLEVGVKFITCGEIAVKIEEEEGDEDGVTLNAMIVEPGKDSPSKVNEKFYQEEDSVQLFIY